MHASHARPQEAPGSDNGLICAMDLDRQGGGRELAWGDLSTPAAAGMLRWIHLDFSQTQAHHWLHSESHLPEAVVDAMVEEDIRPRSLQTPEGVLAILRGVNLNPGSDADDMVSIRVWLEQDRIITTRRRRLMAVQTIQQQIVAGNGPITSGGFLLELVSLLGDRIAEVIDSLDETIEAAEIHQAERRGGAYQGEFGKLRRKTARIRRYLAPQREALDRLSRMQHPALSDAVLTELHEETNRMTLFVEDLDLARERAMVAQEELLNTLAQEQNTKMYLLAIVSAIFLPLSFLTGLFGMNVAGLPGTLDPQAFAKLVGLMIALGGGILVLFRWKRWF